MLWEVALFMAGAIALEIIGFVVTNVLLALSLKVLL